MLSHIRRTSLAIVLTLFAATSGAGAAGKASLVATYGAPDTVYAPVWIAERAGYFAKRDVNVDLQFQASTIQIPSLIAGDVQLALVGCSEVAAANASGADLLIVANLGSWLPYLLMVPDSIKKPSDLIGKAIGISKFGDTTDVASRIALAKMGLRPDQVTFVQVGSSASRTAALLSGAIQAGAVQPPITTILQRRGFHALLDISRLHIASSLALTGQRAWIMANRDTVQRYVAALMDGIAREKRDRAYTLGILKEYLKVDDPQALSDAYDYFGDKTPPAPHATAAQCKPSLEALAATNAQLRQIDVARFIDDEFVVSAARERR